MLPGQEDRSGCSAVDDLLGSVHRWSKQGEAEAAVHEPANALIGFRAGCAATDLHEAVGEVRLRALGFLPSETELAMGGHLRIGPAAAADLRQPLREGIKVRPTLPVQVDHGDDAGTLAR